MFLATCGIAGHDECWIEVQEIREHLQGCRIGWQTIGDRFRRATGAEISPWSLSAGTLKVWSLPLDGLFLSLKFLMRSLGLFS